LTSCAGQPLLLFPEPTGQHTGSHIDTCIIELPCTRDLSYHACYPPCSLTCICRDNSTPSSIVENVADRVSHARMVTKSIGFRVSGSVFKKKWIKADIDLRGTMLSLLPPSTGSSRIYYRRKLATFRIERELLCTRKDVRVLQLNFPAKQRTLY